MEVDISNLNFLELTALKDRIDARMHTMRQESGPQLAERFEEEARGRRAHHRRLGTGRQEKEARQRSRKSPVN